MAIAASLGVLLVTVLVLAGPSVVAACCGFRAVIVGHSGPNALFCLGMRCGVLWICRLPMLVHGG
jgi:hypothetical protein